jgi:hypothetical protein
VKIKKRDYQAMMARIKELQAISDSIISVKAMNTNGDSSLGTLMQCTLGHLYTIRRFGGYKVGSDVIAWLCGPWPVQITLDTKQPDATGYDMYLANKYSSPDDSPSNIITKVTLNDTYGAGETIAEEPRQCDDPTCPTCYGENIKYAIKVLQEVREYLNEHLSNV